jgi:methyl-accepting chemotaxis protein
VNLKTRITLVLAGLGLAVAAVFAVYSYQRGVAEVDDRAHANAGTLLARSVEMFMVSTKEFQAAFQASTDPVEKKAILDDWNRTIKAVDIAVIHDFGEGQDRVRLIGDEQLVGYKPLGGDTVTPSIPFEMDAIREFLNGAEVYEAQEDGFVRVALPLWSDAHPGCGGCHIAVVEGLDADLNKRVLLGSVNAYVPIAEETATMHADLFWDLTFITAGVVALVVAVLFFVNRKVVRPLELMAGDIDETAQQVDLGAQQVASASQVLAQGASEQASSIEESSATLEELTAVAHQNGARSEEARGITAQSADAVKEGGQRIDDVVSAIDEVRQASTQIQKIVSTIDEIAFQTNLLALNAAVEAARAGEAGAGFAVVADEVRGLAQRASEAAKSTSELIETTVEKISRSSELTAAAKTQFQVLGESASKVVEINAEIATASGEQSQGVEQVNQAVSQVQQVVQEVAARSEEAAAASEELTGQAGSLRQVVGSMRSIFS